MFNFRFRKMQEDVVSKHLLEYFLVDNGIQVERSLLWDSKYYCFNLTNWGKVFKDILWNLPAYAKDKFDCDNFAMMVAVRIQEKYKINGCGIAIGDSPWGYHAWNIFLAQVYDRVHAGGIALFYLEPQNGMVYEIDEDSGYKAHYVVWG